MESEPEPIGADRFGRIRELFESALDYADSADRQRFLEQRTQDDPALLSAVYRLLRHHQQIEGRIDRGLPQFGPYRATRVVGSGGQGVVYEAHRADGEFDRRVAIKVRAPGTLGPDGQERLRAERQILAGLTHPGIAQLFEGGVTESGEPYLVVEYVEGKHLDQYCEARGLGPRDRLRMFASVLDAVEYAHAKGVVHRDLKPSNILVSAEGQTKLVDFGAAGLRLAGSHSIDEPGGLTPGYASPEMLTGATGDERSDTYSLGVIYARLMGRSARTSVVRKATAFHPSDRYPSAAALRVAVLDRPWPRRAALAAAFLAGAALLGWFHVTRPLRWKPVIPATLRAHHATVSWDGDWLAYVQDNPSSGSTIFLGRRSGGAPGPIHSGPAISDLSVASGGHAIAYRSAAKPAGIYRLDRNSGQSRLIASGGHRPAWSPDGRWLLFATADNRDDPERTGQSEWHIIPAQGGVPRPIGRDLFVLQAVWAPDSRSVILQAKRGRQASFKFLWRHVLAGGDPLQISSWDGEHIDLCGADSDGNSVVGLGWSGLFRIPLFEGRPQLLTNLRMEDPACHTTLDGRHYLAAGRLATRHYRIGSDGASHILEVPPSAEGHPVSISSASLDGRTVAYFAVGFTSTVIREGHRPKHFPHVGRLSGDGDKMWLRADHGLSLKIYKAFPNPQKIADLVGTNVWSVSHDGTSALGYIAPTRRILRLQPDRQPAPILEHPSWNLYRASLSRDSRFVTFTAHDDIRGLRVNIALLRGTQPVPPSEWIDVADGTSPAFSPSGDRLYFTSKRDGRWCIYQIALDSASGRPASEPKAIAHLHERWSPDAIPESGFTIAASLDGIRFSVGANEHGLYVLD